MSIFPPGVYVRFLRNRDWIGVTERQHPMSFPSATRVWVKWLKPCPTETGVYAPDDLEPLSALEALSQLAVEPRHGP